MLLYGIYLVWRAKPVAPRPAATADAAQTNATGGAAKP
jgi:hypothetical protein